MEISPGKYKLIKTPSGIFPGQDSENFSVKKLLGEEYKLLNDRLIPGGKPRKKRLEREILNVRPLENYFLNFLTEPSIWSWKF